MRKAKQPELVLEPAFSSSDEKSRPALRAEPTSTEEFPKTSDYAVPEITLERIKPEIERIQLPRVFEQPTTVREDVSARLREVSETYPLITTSWKGTKYVLATAKIQFNTATNQLNYTVIEPQLDQKLQTIIEKTIELLKERLDIDFSKLKAKKEVYVYVDRQVDDIWDYLNVNLGEEETLKAKYYIFRDTIGLGKIEPLMRDPNLEDIGCDGVGIPVFVFHRNPLYGSMATNLIFETKEELDSFAMRLAQKAGRTVSVAAPLLDASLPDGSRLQVTFGTDIARKGSNFSIRKFFRVPLTVVDLMNYTTADPLTLAYLWFAIEEQQSILISGTTASGKTTFLNSIAQFIPPTMKIVSIEDTSELQLMHTNWTPAVARSGYGPKKYGEVSMFDLLKAALRQRPDYIIVGEVRGKEADVMFSAMATGHASLSTLHADTVEAVIDRLTTRPINLPLAVLEHLDIIIFLEKAKQGGRFVRKIGQVIEIEGYDRDANKLKTNEAFKWQPAEDIFVSKESYILSRIAKKLGWNAEDIRQEILRRAAVLKWMQDKNISGFKDVAQIINLYYVDPARLAKLMGG
ncbi:MAG: type II/IV secretion system ATPase subunit [Candidatus Nanoarchaeia archaeon]